MDLQGLEFTNCAWRGIRLQAVNELKQLYVHEDESIEPDEFSINWHYGQNCFEVIEYHHKKVGPTHGKHYYLKTWEEVLSHFKYWGSNLPSFQDQVNDFLAEVLAEKI
jgi:hypothetical protein